MRFGNILLNHRICFLSGSDHFFMCVFPRVIILIMFKGGGPQKYFRASRGSKRATRDVSIDFKSRPPP